jgi:VanZ family protein
MTPVHAQRFDLTQLHVVRPVFWCALICGLALLVVFAGLPGRPLILHTLQKLAHPCVFGLIALSALVLQSQRSQSRNGATAQYLIALLTAVLIGVLTEAAQTITHRDPAWRDVGLDMRGALCALALAATFDSRTYTGNRGPRLRQLYLLICIGLAILILTPLSMTLAGYANRSARFPVLFCAERPIDLLLVSTAGVPTTRLRVPSAYADPINQWAVPVPFNVHTTPSVSLDEPSPDWQRYTKIVIDVTNPNAVEIDLVLRIHDH